MRGTRAPDEQTTGACDARQQMNLGSEASRPNGAREGRNLLNTPPTLRRPQHTTHNLAHHTIKQHQLNNKQQIYTAHTTIRCCRLRPAKLGVGKTRHASRGASCVRRTHLLLFSGAPLACVVLTLQTKAPNRTRTQGRGPQSQARLTDGPTTFMHQGAPIHIPVVSTDPVINIPFTAVQLPRPVACKQIKSSLQPWAALSLSSSFSAACDPAI